MIRTVLTSIVAIVLVSPSMAQSRAAQWIVNEQIAEACGTAGGTVAADAVFEGDLTGDGRADFIFSHDGVRCAGGGRSPHCGVQACLLLIYVRRDGLLQLETEMLSIAFDVSPGDPVPTIHATAHDGKPSALRWDGRTFR